MMNFWDWGSQHDPRLPAVIDETGRVVTFGELDQRVQDTADFLSREGSRQFGLLFLSNTLAALTAYLGCLRARHVALLLPPEIATRAAGSALIALYDPEWIMGQSVPGLALPHGGMNMQRRSVGQAAPLADELGLLLSTSGTTGSPKLVRLSYSALQSNASAIAAYLGLGPGERALSVLPPYYSYGMSVLNSHLAAGGCVVLRDTSVLRPEFSRLIRDHEVTSISGVPYTYQMLHRTGFGNGDFPSLRTLTQAGGKLDERLMRSFAQLALERGWKFFVMYGQTEASPRISFVPPDRLLHKIGSIGVPIPEGRLSLDPATQEIVYTGPNVMMGYALTRDDLALGDVLNGVLPTGDVGRQDDDGFFYVTGRLKRFIKLAGNRVNLEEVEEALQTACGVPVCVAGRDDLMSVWIEAGEPALVEQAKRVISTTYGIHHTLCQIRSVDRVPLLPSGKKDYAAVLAGG